MKIARLLTLSFASVFAVLLFAQETRLSNVSVRTSAGGADVLITGFTVGPGPAKQVLVRAAGPTLSVFGVSGAMADPKLELFNGAGAKIAENDNFNVSDAPTFAAVGAFALSAGARDAALVTTLAPGSYTAQVSGLGSTPTGVVLVEVYEVTGGVTRLVNLSTRAQVGTGSNILIPGITVSAGAGTRRLLLRAVGPTLGTFGVAGTIADPKLELYSGTTKVAENDNWGTPVGAGAADAAALTAAFAANGAFALGAGSRDAALLINLAAGSYTLQVSGVGGTTGAALVEVYDLTPPPPPPPTTALYVAPLRPDSAAAGSTASGYATVLVSEDGTSATVNVTFSNLSSAQTSGYLRIGGDPVLSLGLGQVAGRTWTFAPIAGQSTAAIIAALQSGNLTVGIDSAKFPTGELRGSLLRSQGAQIFTVPAAPPALAANALTAPATEDAARFLTQATFGPTTASITALTRQGISAWIDEQMALPASGHLAGVRADVAAFPIQRSLYPPTVTFTFVGRWVRQAVWWKYAITGQDQLRQRVAFALSEIFVVSQADSNLGNEGEELASYYDLLVKGAFGSFRQLLENVTLHPAMGEYLSSLNSFKADPVAGTFPDENYAREVMQLFTIGLVQLQPDGTLMLSSTGQPIPTYNQDTITETAKVLTGWSSRPVLASGSFGSSSPSTYELGAPDGHGRLIPMNNAPRYHDTTAKSIVSLEQLPLDQAAPTLVPANQTGAQDLKILLDTLVAHPNTGPFFCKLLIKRLVTSNPSSGYVYRVAQVFANDGTGVRGNLGAVVRAILTDYEARSPAVINNIGFGKIKEPIIRVAALLRILKASAPNGRFLDSYTGDPRNSNGYQPAGFFASSRTRILQEPLYAPSVFNFFSADYVVPGAMAAAGLVAPEMEITDATYSLRTINEILSIMYRAPIVQATAPTPSPFLVMDYAEFLPNARNPAALLDQLNRLFCAGGLSGAARTEILARLQALPAATTDTARVQSAIHLVYASTDSALQR